MVNSIVSTALSAIAILAISSNNSNVCAFQLSQRSTAVVSSPSLTTKQTTSTFNVVNIDNLQYSTRQQSTTISMSSLNRDIARENSSLSTKRQRMNSLFQVASTKSRYALQKIRHSFTILLASLAFSLSSTHVMHTPPAHASSSATAATLSTTTKSLKQRLNIFKTKSADELIDKYVQSKLFADDVYDPVESAYREAYADSLTNKDTVAGAYPTLLAETAGEALGTSKSVSSLLSSSSKSVGTTATGKNDGITAVLIKASDILQSKLKVSASISYYILAATGIVGVCVVPTMAGVLYQGIQRASIDKSEMKMYGKISE